MYKHTTANAGVHGMPSRAQKQHSTLSTHKYNLNCAVDANVSHYNTAITRICIYSMYIVSAH